MEGTFRGGRLEATYTIGDPQRGGWPLGPPGVFPVSALSVSWTDFLADVADSFEGAAEALGALNYRAPFGGVDFSIPAVSIAGNLLLLDAVVRSPLEPPFILEDGEVLDDPADEALAAIQAELVGFADAMAGSSLPSRVFAEAQLRQAATSFGDAQTAWAEMLGLLQLAPSQALADAVNGWLAAIAEAGAALEAFVQLALGGPFTTVSAASYEGPETAADAIVAGFGQITGAQFEAALSIPLPTSLSNISIRITDSAGSERLAGLFFSSDEQFNFHVPAGTALGQAVLTVFRGDEVIATGRVVIREVAPSLFAANVNGQGVAAALALRVAADLTQTIRLIYDDTAPLGSRATLPIDLGPEGEQVFLVLFGTGMRGFTSGATATVGRGGTHCRPSSPSGFGWARPSQPRPSAPFADRPGRDRYHPHRGRQGRQYRDRQHSIIRPAPLGNLVS